MTYNVSADYSTDPSLASVEPTDKSPLRVVDRENPVTGKVATVPLRLYRQLLAELELSQAESGRLRQLHQTLSDEFEKLWAQHEHIHTLLKTRSPESSEGFDIEDDKVIALEQEQVILKPAPIKPSWVRVEPSSSSPNLSVASIPIPSKIEFEPAAPQSEVSPSASAPPVDDTPSSVAVEREPITEQEPIVERELNAALETPLVANLARVEDGSNSLAGLPVKRQDEELSTPHSALNFLTALRKRDRQKEETYEPLPLPPTLRRPSTSVSAISSDSSESQATSAPQSTVAKTVEIPVRTPLPVSELAEVAPSEEAAKTLPVAKTDSDLQLDRVVSSPRVEEQDTFQVSTAERSVEAVATRPVATPPKTNNVAYVRPVVTDSVQAVPPIVRPARRIEPERSRVLPLRREPEIEDLSQLENVPPDAPPSRQANANVLMGAAGACLLLCVAFGAGFLLVQPIIERIEATPPESAPLTAPETIPAE